MLAASPDEQRGYGDMQPCTGCERHSSSRTADLQLHVQSFAAQKETRSRTARASSLNPPSSPPTRICSSSPHWQPAGHRLIRTDVRYHSAHPVARSGSACCIGSYGPQKHTFIDFSRFTPFPKFPKHWLSNSHFEGDCVKVLTIQYNIL